MWLTSTPCIRETETDQIMVFSKTVEKLLLTAVASVGIGAAWMSWLKDSAIGSMLFMNYSLSAPSAGVVMQILAVLLLLATATLFFKKFRSYGAGFIGIYLAFLIYASIDQGGNPFSDYTLAAFAMRLVTPFVFIIVISKNLQSGFRELSNQIAIWIMILASCSTFIIHGFEAILAHPWFVDMTITMAGNLIGWSISQSLTEQMLMIVGIIDIASAVALLVFRSKLALIWMIFWGFFTCLLRLVNYSFGALPDAIIRLPHGLLPLILYFVLSRK